MALPAFDAASSANTGAAATNTLSWSHTCTGSERYLVVGIAAAAWSGTSVTSVTYNGVALTQRVAMGGTPRSELWDLVNPPAGTFTVEVTLAGNRRFAAGAVSFTGVDQSSPRGASGTFSSVSDTNPEVVLASAADELVVDVVCRQNTSETWDGTQQGPGQTTRVFNATTHATAANNACLGMSTEPGATSTTMSWVWGTARTCSLVALAIKGSAGGGTPIVLSPGAFSAAGAALQINAKTQLGLAPLALPWSGSEVVLNAHTRSLLDALSLPWQGQVLGVNARTQLGLSPVALPWQGQTLSIPEGDSVLLAPLALPWAGSNLQVNAKQAVVLATGSFPVMGQLLLVDQQTHQVIDALNLSWTGQALMVNASTQVTLDPVALPWVGRDLAGTVKINLDPMSLPWTGTSLGINDRVAVVLAPVSIPWGGQGLLVNTREVLTLYQVSLAWTGSFLSVVDGTPPPPLPDLLQRGRLSMQLGITAP